MSRLAKEERRLCGEFWVWLYDERQRRDGTEPTPEEKRAHPSHVALLALRKANPAYTEERNLATICSLCNAGKSDRAPTAHDLSA